MAEQAIPRGHHYVPEFYLAGFTPTGSKEDFLWVRDGEQRKTWRARPRKVAHQRDYYRLEQEGIAPDALEKGFGIVEGLLAPALQRIATGRKPPEGDDLRQALQFIAMLVMRVPSGRELIDRNAAAMAKHSMQMVAGHLGAFESVIERMQRDGQLPDDVDVEQLREFILDDSRYTTSVVPSSTLGTMVELIDSLPPVLAARQWSLVVAKDDAPDFVCTDRPVALVAIDPRAPRHLGFGQTWTEVSIPLSRRATLVGSFQMEARLVEADALMVGFFNQRMLDLAERFVFSPTDEIVVSTRRADDGADSQR